MSTLYYMLYYTMYYSTTLCTILQQCFTHILICIYTESNMHPIQQPLERELHYIGTGCPGRSWRQSLSPFFSLSHITPLSHCPSDTSAIQCSSLSSGPPRAGWYPELPRKLSSSICSTDMSTPNACNPLLWNCPTHIYAKYVQCKVIANSDPAADNGSSEISHRAMHVPRLFKPF